VVELWQNSGGVFAPRNTTTGDAWVHVLLSVKKWVDLERFPLFLLPVLTVTLTVTCKGNKTQQTIDFILILLFFTYLFLESVFSIFLSRCFNHKQWGRGMVEANIIGSRWLLLVLLLWWKWLVAVVEGAVSVGC
jgi:hypothetical protein